MCDPLTIDTGCRAVTVQVRDTDTLVTISHTRPPSRLPLLTWVLGPIQEQDLGPSFSGVLHMTTLTDTQQVSGTLAITDKKGNPSKVQAGSSAFLSTDPNVISVTPDPANELGVTVKAVAAGAATVKWSGDADLGDGVVTIGAAEDFVVTGGQATAAGFSFGTPTEQP